MFCKLFAGPATVQMVSQNRPPSITVPVQVPQGQMMQQYVNENGTFAHVVLSPQYQQIHSGQGHMHAPFVSSFFLILYNNTENIFCH